MSSVPHGKGVQWKHVLEIIKIGDDFWGTFPLISRKIGGEIAENVLDSLWNKSHFQFMEWSCDAALNTDKRQK